MATSNDEPVGVLALQGDFADHDRALGHFGVSTRRVRKPADLVGLAGLVLPGGESTTMLRLLEVEGLYDPLRAALCSGLPVLATCAGLILLASEVEAPSQRSFGILEVAVRRNGYGRQYHSGTFDLESDTLPAGTTAIFIRAPRIVRCGADIEVLARRDGDPVLVRRGPVLGACFHPELQLEHPVTASFVQSVRRGAEHSIQETLS